MNIPVRHATAATKLAIVDCERERAQRLHRTIGGDVRLRNAIDLDQRRRSHVAVITVILCRSVMPCRQSRRSIGRGPQQRDAAG